jgi:hypothetical protein
MTARPSIAAENPVLSGINRLGETHWRNDSASVAKDPSLSGINRFGEFRFEDFRLFTYWQSKCITLLYDPFLTYAITAVAGTP